MSNRSARTKSVEPRNERGSVLLIALIATVLISMIVASLTTKATVGLDIAANHHATSEAFYAADGASRAAFDAIVAKTRELGRFPTAADLATVSLPTIPGITYSLVDLLPDGAQSQSVLDSGFYQGLTALTMPFAASITATRNGHPPGSSTVDIRSIVDLIPIYQFAVFYEHDLEVTPGPTMIVSGRVHTNADLYVDSGSALRFRDVVTVVGDVFNYPEVSTPFSGNTYFRNSLGNDVAMNGLDSNDADWYADALSRWDGNLRSGVHGVEQMRLSIESQANPRIIIEPGYASDGDPERASKLYYSAGLRIVNGVATDATGSPVSLIDPVSGDSVLRPTVIDDRREGHEMLTLEIDVDKLFNLPGFPANGTVYIAAAEPGDGVPNWAVPAWVDTGGGGGYWSTEAWPSAWSAYSAPYDGGNTEFAVKIFNGNQLGAPLTIVTENPAYIRGHYNRVQKQPAAILADTITLLSDNWGRKDITNSPIPGGDPDDDYGYSNLSHNNRLAASTTYNTALVFGAIEGNAVEGNNGGLENALRFAEHWTSRTATYTGSIIVLWYPVHAYSPHLCCGYTYSAPNRTWSFDTDFLDANLLPPTTPAIYSVRLTSWDRS